MLFKVWCEDYGQDADDARAVKAFDAQEAAELWARDADCRSADYTIVGGSPATVKVQQVSIAAVPVAEFVVHGETAAHYSARPVVANAQVKGAALPKAEASALEPLVSPALDQDRALMEK